MKGKAIILALVTMAAFGADAGAAERYPSLWYPHFYRSVASVSGAEGTFFNPAVLKADPELEMGFYHSFNDSTFNGDNGFILARGGVGLGYYNLRLDGKPGVNSWTLAAGTRYGKKMLLGFSYTFYKTDREGYHNDHFWKSGVVYRPNRRLSVGAVIDNINRMEFDSKKTDREYTIGLGIRPFGEAVTLSGDYTLLGGEKVREGCFTGSLELRLKDGLWLSGHADENKHFGIGLSFAFGESVTGAYGSFDRDAAFSSGVISHKYSYNRLSYAIAHPDRYVTLRLSGGYPEERLESFLWRKPTRSFGDLVLGLDRISDDPHITGVALDIDNPGLGWAQLEELRDKLDELRKNGKTVVAFLGPSSGTSTYYLASVADKIAMQRLDDLPIVGLLAEVTFYKGTLDKLGVTAELEHIGEFKTASDRLTRDSMSSAHDEVVNALLDDIWNEVTAGISRSRGISIDSLRKLVDDAPLVSIEAVEAGLVDTLIYPDCFDSWANMQIPGGRSVPFDRYIETRNHCARWGEAPRIAVIPAEGSIVRGKSSENLLLGKTLGSVTLNRRIREAREDNSVKAIVLRVNSPGGTVLGSESIWRELKLTQEKKPVIVSMGNVAASGGYHIASASDWILAQNATSTGSIGVIYGKLNLAGLREKLGFSTYHIKRGNNADFFSWSTGYSEYQQEKVRWEIKLVYEEFVRTVAQNRNATFEEIDKVAQGRSWSGTRALEHHLVDQIGGLCDAIDVACARVNLDRDEVVIDIVPTRIQSLFPSIFPGDVMGTLARSILSPDDPGVLPGACSELWGGLLYRSPYEIRIR